MTVLFCDVVGFTAAGERLDPEALRRLQSRYFDAARAVLERHGATVEKFIGDAVMAVFGVPVVHEDDALRAARAALELRDAVAELGLDVRIGLNTGEVVAGRGDALVTGDAVNTAKRLEEQARPGEILIGELTRALVAVAAETEPGEGPRAAHRLVSVAAEADAIPRMLDSPLVGRERELSALRDEYARAVAERRCRVVSVVGPPGIGKSRLALELAGRVRAEATVLVGRCLSYGDGITYWPLVEIVREAAHHEARARIVELLAGAEDAELVADRVAAAVGEGGEAASAAEISWAVRRLFERLARDRPLVVVLEDLHWAEPTFLDLVEYLAGWTRDAPILLVCLTRPELFDARPAWHGVGAAVTVEPLAAADADAMAESRLEGRELDPAARARIVAASEGNPLFLEQLLEVSADGGNGVAPSIPPTIQAVLSARLDSLQPSERTTLERAAVVGKEFWRGIVHELTPPDERDELPARLLTLVRKGLVRPADTAFPGDDGFQFHHVLIREAAYEAIPKASRAELHERIGAWLETSDRALGREHDEIVGYHLERSYRYRVELGEEDERGDVLARRAGERLAAAGRRALERSDLPAAVSLLSRAGELLPRADPWSIQVAADLGEARWLSGDRGGGEAALDSAVRLADDLGEEVLGARARAARLELRLHRTDADVHSLEREVVRIRAPLERAGDDQGLAQLWDVIGQIEWMQQRAAGMQEALNRALDHARRAGDRWRELTILEQFVMAYSHGPTPVDEAIEACGRILEAAGGAPIVEAAVERVLGRSYAMRGDLEEARRHMLRGIEILDDLGHRTIGAASRGQGIAFVELTAGSAKAAERALRDSLDELEAMGEEGFVSTAAAILAGALLEQGRYKEAERYTQIAEQSASPGDTASQVELRVVRARLFARRGALDEAERIAREAVALAQTSDFPNMRAGTLLALAEVLWRRGDEEGAARAADEGLRLYEAKGNVAAAASTRRAIAELVGEPLAERD